MRLQIRPVKKKFPSVTLHIAEEGVPHIAEEEVLHIAEGVGRQLEACLHRPN